MCSLQFVNVDFLILFFHNIIFKYVFIHQYLTSFILSYSISFDPSIFHKNVKGREIQANKMFYKFLKN